MEWRKSFYKPTFRRKLEFNALNELHHVCFILCDNISPDSNVTRAFDTQYIHFTTV